MSTLVWTSQGCIRNTKASNKKKDLKEEWAFLYQNKEIFVLIFDSKSVISNTDHQKMFKIVHLYFTYSIHKQYMGA